MRGLAWVAALACAWMPHVAQANPMVHDEMPDCVPQVGGDWIDDGDWLHRRLLPRDCTVSLDNPPVLSWTRHPRRAQGAPYLVRLVGPSGTMMQAEADSPRWMWREPLAPGDYGWQVEVQTAQGRERSRLRRFRIDAAQPPCVIPDAGTLLERVRRRSRPRMLPAAEEWQSLQAAWHTSRAREFQRFERSVAAQAGMPLREDDVHAPQRAVNQALGWRYAGPDAWRDGARAQLLAMAGWDADGATSETHDDQRNRAIYLGLARGYDLLHEELDGDERHAVLSAALRRIGDYMRHSGSRALFDDIPYRSHAATSMHYAVEALVLLAGASPQADAWLADLWEEYRTLYPVWGGQDGGDGSGSAYGWLNLMQPPQAWWTLRRAAGIDMACRAFAQHAGLQGLMLTPPVSAEATARWGGPWPPFGDGADAAYASLPVAIANREFLLYAALLPDSRLKRWYLWYAARMRRAQPRSDAGDFHAAVLGLLLAVPAQDLDAAPPDDLPSAIAFAETGTVAMHGSLADDQRVSVYFQSGRYGSFNHARAEQNAFVVTWRGDPVLAGAGAYDGPPASRRHARRTAAKNVVTFDGGQGQAQRGDDTPDEAMEFRGRLVDAQDEGGMAYATGDARLAYRQRDGEGRALKPLLTQAVRGVALLRRSGAVVVVDRVRSEVPRRWEWNLHALQPFEVDGDGMVAVSTPGRRTCIRLSGTPATFSQAREEAAEDGHGAIRWHGRYAARTASTEATFAAVIQPGCAAGRVEADVDAGLGTVRIHGRHDGETLVFDGTALRAQAERP